MRKSGRSENAQEEEVEEKVERERPPVEEAGHKPPDLEARLVRRRNEEYRQSLCTSFRRRERAHLSVLDGGSPGEVELQRRHKAALLRKFEHPCTPRVSTSACSSSRSHQGTYDCDADPHCPAVGTPIPVSSHGAGRGRECSLNVHEVGFGHRRHIESIHAPRSRT